VAEKEGAKSERRKRREKEEGAKKGK